MEKLKRGYYTALGTPIDNNGNIIADALVKQIEMQIAADASGLLLMGSMGAQPGIKTSAYVEAVKIAADANKGRLPLFVGVMDNSIERVLERIDMIKDYNIDAVVMTTPFYETSFTDELISFFEGVADKSAKPVFLYDLPGVTKHKITYPMVEKLAKHPNILGIKSGDIVLGRLIHNNIPDFEFLYSGLDTFDVGISYGIDKVLDGMFAATPANGKKFIHAAWDNDMEACKKHLDNIVNFRDLFIKHRVFPAFEVAMNLLGLDGRYGFTHDLVITDEAVKAEIKEFMKEIGELW